MPHACGWRCASTRGSRLRTRSGGRSRRQQERSPDPRTWRKGSPRDPRNAPGPRRHRRPSPAGTGIPHPPHPRRRLCVRAPRPARGSSRAIRRPPPIRGTRTLNTGDRRDAGTSAPLRPSRRAFPEPPWHMRCRPWPPTRTDGPRRSRHGPSRAPIPSCGRGAPPPIGFRLRPSSPPPRNPVQRPRGPSMR